MTWALLSVKIILCFFIWFWLVTQGTEGCLEKERLGLLKMKKDLATVFSSYDEVLPSWVDDKEEDNCCGWERVSCNEITGRVTHLILDALLPSWLNSEMKTMNFSLLIPFDQLLYLDLSENNFTDLVEIEGLCGLKYLQELDMSHNTIDSLPECMVNLTSLRVIDLSSTNMSGNVPSFITNLKSLEYISFFDTKIDGLFSFGLLANHSKLEVFRLSSTATNLHVETESPPWLPSFQLKALQLANCNLNAQPHNANIPSFLWHQKELRLIDLSHNMLQGNFPTLLLNNNQKLETLRLRNNSFSGTLQLPTYTHGLVNLGISNNKFHGQLPKEVGKIIPNLTHLSLAKNSFEGNLPSSMVEMQRIETLDLSNNKFSGELSRHFFANWTSLELLSLSHNNFSGQVIPVFANSARLKFLFLNNNNFYEEIVDGVSNKSYLKAMDISNNMVSGTIPKWIGSFTSLELFFMSNNLLEAEIPNTICSAPSLAFIDLSENSLSGTLPHCFSATSSLKFLHLQYNTLTGYLPSQFPHTLCSLDLRDNKFYGEISLEELHTEDLRVILLGGNQLNGSIPHKLCQFTMLKILDLSHNRITGTIPSCFADITFGPIERTQLTWSINENSVFSYDSNSTLMLNYNSLEDQHVVIEPLPAEFRTKHNVYSYTGNILVHMSGLDLSGNELNGSIPPEIGQIGNLYSLNLSHNRLSGTIPQSFSNLGNLESLDLSYNMLSGAIPVDMTKLHFLAVFNVSYNNLSGPTPTTGQFANFGEDNYRGNKGLFGYVSSNRILPPLPPPSGIFPTNEGGENHTTIELASFYYGFVSSFVTVVLGLTLVLWFSPRGCRVWFQFVDFCACVIVSYAL